LCSSATSAHSNFILFIPCGFFTRYLQLSFYQRLFCAQRNTAASAAHECHYQEMTTLLGCGAVAMCMIADISKRIPRSSSPKNGLKVGNLSPRNGSDTSRAVLTELKLQCCDDNLKPLLCCYSSRAFTKLRKASISFVMSG